MLLKKEQAIAFDFLKKKTLNKFMIDENEKNFENVNDSIKYFKENKNNFSYVDKGLYENLNEDFKKLINFDN